jgi:hypothetical protein
MFKEMEESQTAGTAMGCSNFFPFMSSFLMQCITGWIKGTVKGDAFDVYMWSLWVPVAVATVLGSIGAVLSKDTFDVRSRIEKD